MYLISFIDIFHLNTIDRISKMRNFAITSTKHSL